MNTTPHSADTDDAFALLEFEGDALDPDRLAPLIPLSPSRFRKKGDAIGRMRNGTVTVASTGYYSVSTAGKGLPNCADAHLQLMIEALVDRLGDIKTVAVEQSLTWHILFFDGFQEGTRFSDLSAALCQQVAELGIALHRKEADAFTTILDPAWSV